MKKKLRLWLIKKLNALSNEDYKYIHDSTWLQNTRLGAENKSLREELQVFVNALDDSNTLLKQISDTLPNIKDSDKNEGTDSPWWAIIKPIQIMRKDPCAIASCIVGVWFSRESAEAHLNSRRYEYGDSAIVYCFSGYWSAEYKQLLKDIDAYRSEQ